MSIASNLSSLVSTTNVVVVSATTQSVSTASGALIVRGGAGIAGNIYGGGSATFASTLTARTVTITTATASTSTTTGALVVAGGVGIGGSLTVGGNVNVQGFVSVSAGADILGANTATFINVLITGTTAAVSTTTGALQVAGGVGVQGDIYFGGNLYQNGVLFTGGGGGASGISSTGTTSTFTIGNTTTSVSSTTGALQVLGGVGVVGDLNVGGNIYDSGQRVSPLRNLSLYQAGNLNTSIGTVKWYAPFDIKLVSVVANVGTAPGAPIIVTLKSNNTGVVDVTVPGAGTTSNTSTTPVTITKGSYLTVDVSPTSNTSSLGAELYLIIVYQVI
jgi:hypothetical protein